MDVQDNNFIPILPLNVFIKKENDKNLILNPNVPDWILVNDISLILLSFIDNNRNVKEIVSLARSLNCDLSDNEIFIFFNNKKIKSFLTNKHFSKKTNKLLLNNIHLHLTEKCNLKCSYCFVKYNRKKNINNLKEKYIYNFLKEVKKKYSPNITITGGEPMLHPDFYKIIDFIKNKIKMNMILLTNGTQIKNNDIAKKIAPYFDFIQISLDSSTSEINDIIRGKGVYQSVNNAIEILEKNKINFRLAVTVSKKNENILNELVKKYGNKLIFQPLYKLNSKNTFINENYLTGKKYYNSLNSVESIKNMRNIENIIMQRRNNPCYKCSMGNGSISISSKGNIYPCHMLHFDEFNCGNIISDQFENIYFNSPILNKIRNLTVEDFVKCNKCEIKLICGGACRARNYYYNRKLTYTDSFCDYEKTVFIESLLKSMTR